MADRDSRFEVASATPVEADAPRPRRWRKLALMASVPLLLAGGASAYYIANDHYVSTDNAYVQQDKVSVSAELSGRIVEVNVAENQPVKAGDVLFRLDAEPYRIAMAQADATIAAAQVRVTGLQSDLSAKGVDIAGAQEDVRYYEAEYRRQAELSARGFTTKARLEAAEHSLANARADLADAQAKVNVARAALATAPVAPGVNPAVLAGQVQKRKASYDLARTVVRAPASGVVSQADRLLVGQMMTQGLPAVSIVVSNRSWVEANFKETDLADMRVGQPAELRFDAYPDLRLKGHVASIGAGTGSEFSVLPAQNANGNWVKVTQRVPVRIALDEQPDRPLLAGLSTHVRIDTGR